MDIQSFFDSVTRTKVHRVLKRLGIPHEDALEITRVSTVKRVAEPGRYSVPFGFVQSMVLASAALDWSQVGKHLRIGHRYHVKVSVYVEDILLSAEQEQHLDAYMADLLAAGDAAGYRFNASKTSPPGSVAEAFNIIVSGNDLRVSAPRMAAFEGVVRAGAPETAAAVLRYVRSVNRGQAERLGRLAPYVGTLNSPQVTLDS
jgi:Reverse transcriptase (RNA-dependent DNA polymerase)